MAYFILPPTPKPYSENTIRNTMFYLMNKSNIRKENLQILPVSEDLSTELGEWIYATKNHAFLFRIGSSDKGVKNNTIPIYAMIELLLHERQKLMYAISLGRRMDAYGTLSEQHLLGYKKQFIDTMKINLTFDLVDPEENLKNRILRDIMGVNDLAQEVKDMFIDYLRIISINSEIRLEQERSKKEKALDRARVKEKKLDNMIQWIALLFAVPAAAGIIDVLYEIQSIKLILFPKGEAKLFFVLIAMITLWHIFKPLKAENDEGHSED